ncbi:MAG: papain-like cysteine protease family protein [Sedimentisphaerales bacterium]
MKSRILATLVIAFLWAASSQAGTLDVPLHGQHMDNWCWDASSQMVLEYYGHDHTQEEIADWAVDGYNVPNHLSSAIVGPLAAPTGTPPPATPYNRKGCALVLTNFGPVYSAFVAAALTEAQIVEEIDGNRPAILLIRWLKKAKDVGGHIIVLRGYDSDGAIISLNDPWPENDEPNANCDGVNYIVGYDDMFDPNGTYSGSVIIGNRWSQTLKTGRSLDLCFLIDSTGSMTDDIDDVKALSLTLIDGLTENYKDLRIAVVDYRDNPECAECGELGVDYITNVDTTFTTDANTAKDAINAITIGNGMDWPEAVFSAVIRTMSGTEIGGWRKDAERRIILMGDAPGHDPEPWDGGYSFADVLAFWAAEPNKVAIHALAIYDTDAEAQFGALAAATGGSTRYVDYGGAADAMSDVIDEFTATPRFPRGDTTSFMPVFTFTPPSESMGPPAKNILLEIQKLKVDSDPNTSTNWKNYLKVKLAKDATSWKPTKIFPQGNYRWRLGYVYSAGPLMLPSGASRTIKGATLMETDWTEFTRVEVEPSAPVQLTPASAFTADDANDKVIHYQFNSAVNASSYAMEIYKYDTKKCVYKCWKKLTVKPPAKDPTAEILDVKVSGHTIGSLYRWRVQSLNYDRPKPDPYDWVGLP